MNIIEYEKVDFDAEQKKKIKKPLIFLFCLTALSVIYVIVLLFLMSEKTLVFFTVFSFVFYFALFVCAVYCIYLIKKATAKPKNNKLPIITEEKTDE